MTITGPYHVNVNCSDLDVSLAFYRDVLGFSPVVHTAPDVQPGAAFGFDEGPGFTHLVVAVPDPAALMKQAVHTNTTNRMVDPDGTLIDSTWVSTAPTCRYSPASCPTPTAVASS